MNNAAERKVSEVTSTNLWISGKMCTEIAKMAVSTLKLETILIPDTVLQEAITKLNAMNR